MLWAIGMRMLAQTTEKSFSALAPGIQRCMTFERTCHSGQDGAPLGPSPDDASPVHAGGIFVWSGVTGA